MLIKLNTLWRDEVLLTTTVPLSNMQQKVREVKNSPVMYQNKQILFTGFCDVKSFLNWNGSD